MSNLNQRIILMQDWNLQSMGWMIDDLIAFSFSSWMTSLSCFNSKFNSSDCEFKDHGIISLQAVGHKGQ